MSQIFQENGCIIPVTWLLCNNNKDIELLSKQKTIKITGISKGKGFQGVVKRWGFKGDSASHGTKHTLRAPGSIGSAFPEKVFKGKKMAGRGGHKKVTLQNIEIIKINKKNNKIAVKGSLPGPNKSELKITI